MNHNKMEQMPIPKLLLSMSLPAMFSMLIGALYNIVDSLFVARISDNALTAVSLAFPIQNFIICVAVGTGIGINSLISRRLGAKMQDDANEAARHGMFLAICNGIAIAIFGILTTGFFFNSFTKIPEILTMGKTYTYIITTCSVFNFLGIHAEKIMQSTGNMKGPMLQHIIGSIVNIILDPIFIFGYFGVPAMGVAGAAIATIIGQMVGCGFGLYMLFFMPQPVHMSLKRFRIRRDMLKEIYRVGLPSIVMQSISSVTIICMNGILIGFSELAVSVLGIYYKVQSFIFMPVFGLSQGALPIIGYSYGAKNKHRLIETYRWALIIALGIMALGTILFNIFPSQIIMMFSDTTEMVDLGIQALRGISLCFLFAGVGIISSSMFQGVARGAFSLILSIVRQLVFIIPAAWLLARYFGLSYVWYAFPLAELVGAIMSIFFVVYLYKKDFSHFEEKAHD